MLLTQIRECWTLCRYLFTCGTSPPSPRSWSTLLLQVEGVEAMNGMTGRFFFQATSSDLLTVIKSSTRQRRRSKVECACTCTWNQPAKCIRYGRRKENRHSGQTDETSTDDHRLPDTRAQDRPLGVAAAAAFLGQRNRSREPGGGISLSRNKCLEWVKFCGGCWCFFFGCEFFQEGTDEFSSLMLTRKCAHNERDWKFRILIYCTFVSSQNQSLI